jgi:7,8-dihydro-6-hydroxymethylpterin-pyrophosphokinase
MLSATISDFLNTTVPVANDIALRQWLNALIQLHRDAKRIDHPDQDKLSEILKFLQDATGCSLQTL